MSRYGDLGVDADKAGIGAFRNATRGIYELAFCDIHPDPDLRQCGYVKKPDGAGSKPVQNYLNWKVTGDLRCFEGIPQDTLGMNVGDVFCVGVPTHNSFTDYIAVNRFHVPKEPVLEMFGKEWEENFEMLRRFGIEIHLDGGETADLPDQTRTIDAVGDIYSRFVLDSVITGEKITPGDKIVGLASGGQANYEKKPSGWIMCNGLTLARHCLMRPEFAVKYPEITEPGNEYTGPYGPTDKPKGLVRTVGAELTMPTRLFPPIFKGMIEEFGGAIHGIVFNTGGGNTKCLRIGRGIRYVKENMPVPAQIFGLIQQHGRVTSREMYKDFNMNVGADVIVDPGASKEVSEFVVQRFGIDTYAIGECKRARGDNKVRIETPDGNFNYRKKKKS
jgi:phosphoribosylformylglycinamidine cyclo-ligase